MAHPFHTSSLMRALDGLREDAAPGIDGMTRGDYSKDAEARIMSLSQALHGEYWEPRPVRRVYIAKNLTESRPLGIPCVEEKVVQNSMLSYIKPGMEMLFTGHSYGYREGIGTLDACKKIKQVLSQWGGGWVLDADIKGFFDNMVHDRLMEMLKQVGLERQLRRVIFKMLKAGVVEDGVLKRTPKGTPQGGIISPILSNLYLHVALDDWFDQVLIPHVGGGHLVRYADDFVLLFKTEAAARHAWKLVDHRLREFGLQLHGTKTKLVDCHPSGKMHAPAGPWPMLPRWFSFLGFTFSMDTQVSSAGQGQVHVSTSSLCIKKSTHRWLAWSTGREFKGMDAAMMLMKFRHSVGGFLAYQEHLSDQQGLEAYLVEIGPLLKDLLSQKASARASHRASLEWILTPENIPMMVQEARRRGHRHSRH